MGGDVGGALTPKLSWLRCKCCKLREGPILSCHRNQAKDGPEGCTCVWYLRQHLDHTLSHPTLFQIVTELSYGKKTWPMEWIFCESHVFWDLPGPHGVPPKRPKQHIKHWGGVGRWAGKGGKSSSSNWIVPTTSTFFDDPKIKWWILKILLHVQLFPNKVERFNFYYTQESERESKLEDANRGEWSKVCIAQMWSQLATCNIGCSPQVLHVALEVLLGV